MPLFPFIVTEQQRPNVIEDTKDEAYHSKFARWTLSGVHNPLHHNHVTRQLINWNFYKNNQWILDEDRASFFLDESGEARNRIKVTRNLIRPMVEQYRGNAVRLDLNARAFSASEQAINRREEALARAKFFGEVANQEPEFAESIRQNLPVGETEAETELIFENTYTDELSKDMNRILRYQEQVNDFEELKVRTGLNMAISGMGVMKGRELNNELIWETLNPLFFYFDRGAKRPDLKDAMYMGDYEFMSSVDIFERFQDISDDERKAIEQHAVVESHNINRFVASFFGYKADRIPVYETYWKDAAREEYGWVLDPFNYEVFTKINSEDSDFTDKDLITPSSEKQKKRMKGKKKKVVYTDVLRYAIFIPREELSSGKGDILLEWGVAPNRESDWLKPSSVEYPYKVQCWGYDNGDVLSPIDDAIDPQRMINRLSSIAESKINSSGGEGVIIAEEAIGTDMGEEEVYRNINRGRPIKVSAARMGSVQNAVGKYDATVSASTFNLYNIIQETMRGMQDTTGINEAMTGTLGGGRKLVGVLQQQIQSGTLIQEGFYFALGKIFEQVYQMIGTVGKRIYGENPRKLAIMTGDKGAERVIATEDLLLEDFRIFVKRTTSEADQIESGNNILMTLLQLGMVDQATFSDLFNRSSTDEVADGLRKFQGKRVEAQKIQDQAEQEQAAQLQQQVEAQRQEEGIKQQQFIERDDLNKDKDRQLEIDKIFIRNEGQKEKQREKAALESAKDR